ncbi:nucleotidyl transferase AbiEii/AbiGii toxin family protein [Micromonospora sp. WMMD1102]|uniref:nucleotidyl transferase AbiEii/AbiGii toxin family protein n=1 Tax=Micromonospora sp. WMMD1102 TaxID=3016105 RepID=UPI0024150212|nr:nucleotidyl transferase AbiEii/AbiGii toxin family protein [Micromonospora sp. WMMD1102]MDG4790699.1 nucleotidyl transferase AbiEii/AbiGii toxin family protein [Micromonospora sp. WMMD1102]
MDPFHERLARTGLDAADRYGFALAGGYAVQAAGLLERPSEDVDLFTAWDRRDEFTTAVTAVLHAYRDQGMTVDVERQYDTFARLTVTDGRQVSKVELGVDWRANEPILLAVGPVLHPDDALANKMSALYGRAFARDFIDIDAALRSGRYTHESLLELAQRADRGFDRRVFAGALGQAGLLDPDDFARYGVSGQALSALRNRFAAWRRQLLDG